MQRKYLSLANLLVPQVFSLEILNNMNDKEKVLTLVGFKSLVSDFFGVRNAKAQKSANLEPMYGLGC